MSAVQALILAAGAGVRMGTPKATLLVHGETLLARQVRMLRAAGVLHITAVLSAHQATAEQTAGELGILTVCNPDPARGMGSSVRCGAESLLPHPAAPLLVLPVDCAFARSADVQCLLAAMSLDLSPDTGIWRPSCDGRSGHPVLFGRALLKELSAMNALGTLRTFIQDRAANVRWVRVDNPLLHRDLDHPQDLADLPREI